MQPTDCFLIILVILSILLTLADITLTLRMTAVTAQV